MTKIHLILLSLILPSFTNAAILIDDGIFGKTKSKSIYSYANNTYELKKRRKMGIGTGFSGSHGLIGLDLELNFTPEVSLTTQFGLAKDFRSFGLRITKIIAGRNFSPYISGGITRWFTNSAPSSKLTETYPSFLAEKFLNDQEKLNGFSEVYIYPAFGVQYIKLNGDWSGMSLYAEALLLIDIDDFVVAPTGGVGMKFYF